MYATLALLQFDGSAQAEYALAGHVPILHYRDRSRDTTRLSMEQFPLGLMPGGCYESQRVPYLPGDLFLMLTDGISEVSNDRDEEFGLAPRGATADATLCRTLAANLGEDHGACTPAWLAAG